MLLSSEVWKEGARYEHNIWAVPFLFVLVTEVEEAWGVEQQLHQVVRHQQHQAQTMEAEQRGNTQR